MLKVRYSGDLLKGVQLELGLENMGREGKGGKYQSKQTQTRIQYDS